jgi:hypothetical protein
MLLHRHAMQRDDDEAPRTLLRRSNSIGVRREDVLDNFMTWRRLHVPVHGMEVSMTPPAQTAATIATAKRLG